MRNKKTLVISVLILLILVPLGFYTKMYSGPGHEWVNNKLGGVLYELFWCLLFFILLPKAKPFPIAIWVFIFTCALEFVQLLNNSWLEIIRANFIGQTILGHSFSWSDFPYYFAGSLIGYVLMKWISRSQES